MKVAALYDIHGNLPALESVLSAVAAAHVDRIVCGGDVVPGPMPRECLDLLTGLKIPIDFVQGNCEAEAVAALRGLPLRENLPAEVQEVTRWCAAALTAAQQQAIGAWRLAVRHSIDGIGDVLFCHATPRSQTEIVTQATPDERMLQAIGGAGAHLVVCGHTHMQYDRMVAGTRVVNAGSVGMPFGEPGAYWVLLGPDITLQRTPYDYQRAAQRIRETRYPQAEDFAGHNVVKPPSVDEALAVFQK